MNLKKLYKNRDLGLNGFAFNGILLEVQAGAQNKQVDPFQNIQIPNKVVFSSQQHPQVDTTEFSSQPQQQVHTTFASSSQQQQGHTTEFSSQQPQQPQVDTTESTRQPTMTELIDNLLESEENLNAHDENSQFDLLKLIEDNNELMPSSSQPQQQGHYNVVS